MRNSRLPGTRRGLDPLNNPLVLDASTAVAEVLRSRGMALFQDERLELCMSEEAWSETQHELEKRVAVISRRSSFSAAEQAALLTSTTAALSACLYVVPTEAYAPFQTAALGRIPQDPNDWATVALALAIDAGVWTEDRDFFGSGLATWRTPVLRHVIEMETE